MIRPGNDSISYIGDRQMMMCRMAMRSHLRAGGMPM